MKETDKFVSWYRNEILKKILDRKIDGVKTNFFVRLSNFGPKS